MNYRRPGSGQAHLWRILSPRWSHAPLSGAGAAYHGGRWNRIGTPALYLSEPFAGVGALDRAWAEYQQDIGTRIGTAVPYEVDLRDVADLTDPETLARLGIDPPDLLCLWKQTLHQGLTPPTWSIADRLIAENVSAVRVPSFVKPGGINLVIWALDGSKGGKVSAVDPTSDLPVNQASWPAVKGP